MDIGGIQKVSLIDYPDKLATIIFTNGSVFKCHYCYNSGLVLPLFQEHISWDEIIAYLKKRKDVLDAVVITGGEPTMQPDLLAAVKEIKGEGWSEPTKFDDTVRVISPEAAKQMTEIAKVNLNRYRASVIPQISQPELPKDIRKLPDSVNPNLITPKILEENLSRHYDTTSSDQPPRQHQLPE